MARTVAIGIQDFSDLIRKNYFYIDKKGTLWGCGDNNCGQLGIGKKTTYKDTEDGSTSIDEPQKIAENVVHVPIFVGSPLVAASRGYEHENRSKSTCC